jgi:hypothetical protein
MNMPRGKLERLITSLNLETPIAHLPMKLRHAVGERRYGWLNGLAGLRHTPEGSRSLIETENLNAIFVHVPKAAGMSISQSLFGNDAASHTPLYMYLALYGARKFDNMYKFTFVRNPWHRCISAFNFLRRGGLTDTDSNWAKTHLHAFSDVGDFVERGLGQPKIGEWVHFRPQMSFLKDPRTGTVGVDFIGRFETIGNDFKTVANELGVTASLKHVNKSEAKVPRMSRKARKIIASIYSEDIEAFGYRDPFV